MSNDLFTGIYTHFSAEPHNDFYNGVEGRLEYVRGLPEWVDNYSIMDGTGFHAHDTFDSEIDEAFVQFSLFSTSRLTCGELLKKCKALFDGVLISIPNHYPVKLKRELQLPPTLSDNIEIELWQAVIEFDCMIQKV